MPANIFQQLKTASLLLLFTGILTGIIYPAIVTLLAQYFFPFQANGSLLEKNAVPVGSLLIGQCFTGNRYFHGRPSATAEFPCNPLASGGSNLGPSNPALIESAKKYVSLIRQGDPGNNALIPVELVTASGSGLDPEISPNAAFFQAHRIAKARGLQEQTVRQIIQQSIQDRTFGILGEPRVNVLQLNLLLDRGKSA
jgi:potassium-transporting ATPase KdpC subunit